MTLTLHFSKSQLIKLSRLLIGYLIRHTLGNWTVRSSRKINEFARVPAPKVVQGAQSLKRSHNKAYRGSA